MNGPPFSVVLDANVLVNYGVCDLLLRLAEHHDYFRPHWSDQILDETFHAQMRALNWSRDRAIGIRSAVDHFFASAKVFGHERWIPKCTNHPKDRHVLACAIEIGAPLIVTFNLKDFNDSALDNWEIKAVHPDDFLVHLWNSLSKENEVDVATTTQIMADSRGCAIENLLHHLAKSVPKFANTFLDTLNEIDIN